MENILAKKMIAGSYNSETDSRGIYFFEFDDSKGALNELFSDSQSVNPSFLAGKGEFLIAVNEVDSDSELSMYRVEEEKKEFHLIDKIKVPGAALCHIHIWKDSDYFTVAGYGSGSFLLCKIEGDGIRLVREYIPKSDFCEKEFAEKISHVHSTICVPGRYQLLVADLGLDRVFCYDIAEDETGAVVLKPQEAERQLKFPCGEGPRHTVFSPDEKYYYVFTELKSNIYVFRVAWNGKMTLQQTVHTLPCGYQSEAAGADIHISNDGKYLYVSNRGPDTLTVFRRDLADGTLELIQEHPSGGHWPRNFCLSCSQDFIIVANERSGTISVYERDSDTGRIGEKREEKRVQGVSFVETLQGD